MKMKNIVNKCVYGLYASREEAGTEPYQFNDICFLDFYRQLEAYREHSADTVWVAITTHTGDVYHRREYITTLCKKFSFLKAEYSFQRHPKVFFVITDETDLVWVHLFLGLLRLSWEFLAFWPEKETDFESVIVSILIKKGWNRGSFFVSHTPFHRPYSTKMSAKEYLRALTEIIEEKTPFTEKQLTVKRTPKLQHPLSDMCYQIVLGKKKKKYNPFD